MRNCGTQGLHRGVLAKLLAGGLLAVALISISAVTKANISNIVYNYDGRGRLTSACDARPASGDLTVYRYDAANNRSVLIRSRTDQTLPTGSYILSADGRFELLMQSDGNLVAYSRSGSTLTPLGWSTNTVGSGATIAAFQSDGNLVLYSASGSVWDSNTAGREHHCATLSVQNDGNVVIKTVDGNIAWQSNTGGH